MYYMRKTENNVTNNVTLLSQILSCFCDVIVTKKAITSMNISDMSVTLNNKQGE